MSNPRTGAACRALLTLLVGAAAWQPVHAAAVALGIYRAVLSVPGGDLPFGLELKHEGGATVGYLLNGPERVRLTEVQISGAHLEIRMPGYETYLQADAGADGALSGELVADKLGGKSKEQHVPFHAQPGARYRFFPTAAAPAGRGTVAGRWAVEFIDDGGAKESAVGEFKQQGESVTGTFLTETGDHRYLAGQVRAGRLYLSTFDGGHVFLYHAELKSDGTLSGDYWSGLAYHERWSAHRDPHAALRDPYALTALKGGDKKFDFAFPDLAGHSVSSQDPQFRGKVLIVALAGSWCPNCHDEAAFLAPLYRQYRGRGVEVVALMFEHFGDFEHAAAATQRFRAHYGIEYPTLIAGISDKDDAAQKLPALDHVYAFPTTIFIDKHGLVRKIHTGFSGPATGEHYTQFVDEVHHTLDELLAER